MNTRLTTLARMLAVALLASLMLATPALAHDDHDDDDHHDGTSTATAASGHDELGAFIRKGSCDKPGDVVGDIGDLEPGEDDIWSRVGQGEQEPDVVYGEDEDVDMTIDALTSADHVITIHERDDASSAVIACGAISGDVHGDGTLMIDLDEVDDSGFQGRAHFDPEHNDDDETEITVGVWEAQAAGV